MAYYLVSARPKPERLDELRGLLRRDAFLHLRPFSQALSHSLTHARKQPDGLAVWEEEDYCSPPLAQERAAVLDPYFDELQVRPVLQGFGWAQLRKLPHLLPELPE